MPGYSFTSFERVKEPTCRTCGRELRAHEAGTCSYECQLEVAVSELTNKPATEANPPLNTTDPPKRPRGRPRKQR